MLKFFKLKNIFILWRVQSRDYWKSSKTYKQNSIKLRVSRNPWSLSKSQEIFYMIFLFFNFLIEQAFGFGHTCYNFFHKTAVMDDVNTVRSHSSITNTPPLALKLSFISQNGDISITYSILPLGDYCNVTWKNSPITITEIRKYLRWIEIHVLVPISPSISCEYKLNKKQTTLALKALFPST